MTREETYDYVLKNWYKDDELLAFNIKNGNVTGFYMRSVGVYSKNRVDTRTINLNKIANLLDGFYFIKPPTNKYVDVYDKYTSELVDTSIMLIYEYEYDFITYNSETNIAFCEAKERYYYVLNNTINNFKLIDSL